MRLWQRGLGSDIVALNGGIAVRLIIFAVLASLSMGSALANSDSEKACAARWKSMSTLDRGTLTYQDYTRLCTKGKPTPPPRATAQCKDGTYSTSAGARSRCSGHGGVKMVITL